MSDMPKSNTNSNSVRKLARPFEARKRPLDEQTTETSDRVKRRNLFDHGPSSSSEERNLFAQQRSLQSDYQARGGPGEYSGMENRNRGYAGVETLSDQSAQNNAILRKETSDNHASVENRHVHWSIEEVQKKIQADERSRAQAKKEITVLPSLEKLVQKLAKAQETLQEYQKTLSDNIPTLHEEVRAANELANWNVDKHFEVETARWAKEQPPGYASQRYLTSIYTRADAAESIKVYLEERMGTLQEMKEARMGELDELSRIKASETNYYDGLRFEIKQLDNKDLEQHLLRRALIQQSGRRAIIEVLEGHRQFLITKIDAATEGTRSALDKATRNYEDLERQKPKEHPFFRKHEIFEPDKQPMVKLVRGGPGRDVVDVVDTLLQARRIVTDQTLRSHPYGGGIDVTQLDETVFRSLGDESGLRYQKLELKDLRPEDLAVFADYLEAELKDEGPMGAILDTNPIVTPEDRRIRLAALLHDIEWDANDRPQVVVSDKFHPTPYKVGLREFMRGWKGDVFASGDLL